MSRAVIAFVLGIYLGAGLSMGMLMQRAIPAINPLGIAYYSVAWPRIIICARTDAGCETVPEWLGPWIFSFPAAQREG